MRVGKRPRAALFVALVTASLVASFASCDRGAKDRVGGSGTKREPGTTETRRRRPVRSDPDALPTAEALAPERRAIQVLNGEERVVDADLARERGLAIVDLGDDWAPRLFDDGKGDDGSLLPNRYRSVFVGLANDRTDGDGQPLPAHKSQYLELYGIPPSLSVLRERFLADAARTCEGSVDTTKLLAVDGIRVWGATTEKQEHAKHAQRKKRLEAARERLDAGALEDVATADPKLARDVKEVLRFEAERAAFAELEKRLACEGLLDTSKHQAGFYDTAMRTAVVDFQHKNVIFDHAELNRPTLEAAARPILENGLAALRRVLAERVAAAGGFIEDGSVVTPARGSRPAKVPTYALGEGERRDVPDLVGSATAAVLERLEIETPQDAVEFFRRHPVEDFRWLKVPVRLPELPPYYGEAMELSAEIDRGDVWYDFPFDGKGNRLPQPRERFPSLTVFVKWQGQRVPLVRWRTTIGGWRAELAGDGQEYLRWKGSDVGARVWRHIVAAPVWIPPPSSPLGGMTKVKWVNGAFVRVTNYDETGPGYLSAYGLAAAIHEQMGGREGSRTFFDNGIRTHGSFDYMSLRGRFSHGCHRLHNHLAVRLFSFLLAHRPHRVKGPMALDYRRTFFVDGATFDLRLPTRGFYYELLPPMPIEVLEGTIKGAAQKPLAGYMRKPGVSYASSAPPPVRSGPDDRAGGGAGPAEEDSQP